MAGKEGEELVGDLAGVTARPAEDVEQDLLAKAQRATGLAAASNDSGWEKKQRRIQKRLRLVQQELLAVRGAVEGFDTAAQEGEDQAAQAASQSEAAGQDLQLAGLQQRMHDLQAQEQRLQGALETMQQAIQASSEPQPTLANTVHEEVLQQPAAAAVAQDLPPDDDAADEGLANGLVETERDRLIRLGVLTPFDNLSGFERRVHSRPAEVAAPSDSNPSTSGRTLAEDDPSIQRMTGQLAAAKAVRARTQMVSVQDAPRRERAARRVDEGFWRQAASNDAKAAGQDGSSKSAAGVGRSTKRQRAVLPKRKRLKQLQKAAKRQKRLADAAGEPLLQNNSADHTHDSSQAYRTSSASRRRRSQAEDHSGSEYDPSASDSDLSLLTSDDQVLEDGSDDLLDDDSDNVISSDDDVMDLSGEWDDADDDLYGQRRARWDEKQRAERAERSQSRQASTSDVEFEGGYKLPLSIYEKLFDYQQTGVKWLWELHTQRSGGIIGDEMGLGKTIQVAAFLAGLVHSRLFRPTLIVCPATVMRQWLRELRTWYPPFRVVILHESARASHASRPAFAELVKLVARAREGICVTSYEQLRRQRAHLIGVHWGYVVLDEGHKIRNPDAEVTLAAKQLATVHRIIMTGSPIQNRLAELWSLFDFVFPGKLGTLPVFQTQFALPIQMGGYANASAMQVSTAYKCAVVLRDLIAPYLLRRRKADVAKSLPKKTEQVLFVQLGNEQRDLYCSYLASQEVEDILEDRRNALAGIDIMRKICNHPDLLQRAKWEGADDYGNPKRSGKLAVALKVLEHWRLGGHRALLFAQTQQMLDILEKAASSLGLRYHRMDGSTAVAQRARLVDHFNSDDSVFLFLLTTKVGGIGINLTGADRVMLYDPDWNPSTDMQARERAWRLGQQRDVTIYRLITSGTIEEKVYHRQIYKQFLTNKVLSDPRQKRFFKSKDMRDLFTLGDQYVEAPETATIFAGLDSAVALDRTPASRPASAEPAEAAAAPSSAASAPAGAAVNGLAAAAVAAAEDGDAGILRDLFEGTGIMGALDHAKIEGANDPEARTADAEAARIAKKAADALRQSRAARQADAVNVPTWTGRSGTGGLPSASTASTPPRRFGTVTNPLHRPDSAQVSTPASAGAGLGGGRALRSQDLLAKMRQRQHAAASDGASNDSAQDARASALTGRIVAALAERGGTAPSSDLVGQFAEDVPQAEMYLFRHLLQQVAKLRRSSTGAGKEWVLNAEFVPDSTEG